MGARLDTYQAKRNFERTPEPRPAVPRGQVTRLRFVVQKHEASHLHYDFRLELDGRLLSWSVPKGPSLDPKDKRLAVQVEDHPVAYARFEGTIPEGQYGAGTVTVWDHGHWVPDGGVRQARQDYADGKLRFRLDGDKLHGHWTLVRTRLRGSRDKAQWLLIKQDDEFARPDVDITAAEPGSVLRHHPARPPGKASQAEPGKAAESEPPGARKAALPDRLEPQLATLVDAPPADAEGWSFELKLDGYRILARIGSAGGVQLYTRTGQDWSARLAPQREALSRLEVKGGAWIDGEIVVLDARGRPDFQALQNAFDRHRAAKVCFVAFDLPYAQGQDLRAVPLVQRRHLLRQLLAPHLGEQLRFSEDVQGAPAQLLHAACEQGLEGLIGKRTDAPYEPGRTRSWIKLKCQQRQEFVVVGFTEPQGKRQGLGALLLGVHEQGALRYAGHTGTGFDTALLKDLRARLDKLEVDAPAFEASGKALAALRRRSAAKVVHWVRPELVAEVAFAEWTGGGLVRQAAFQGLRTDKPAADVGTEQAVAVETLASAPVVRGLRISSAERVVDPASGATKLDLVRYYDAMAERLLPHLKGRPVAVLRAPEGVQGELVFQKHVKPPLIPKAQQLDPALDPGHAPLIAIGHATALVGAAQFNVVELHTWNALATSIERPDRVVFDLDPGSGLPWEHVLEAAGLVRTLLDELGLASFVKTSGGKGLHVVVPIARRHGWDQTLAFAKAVSRHLAATLPQRFTATPGARHRVGKVFVDYLRNSRGATSVCAWSVRARPTLPVSVPVSWDELTELRSSAQWTIRNVEQRLQALGDADPWQGYATAARQRLARALRRLPAQDQT
jgi:bifunctional non-homologous end joining protein LigD